MTTGGGGGGGGGGNSDLIKSWAPYFAVYQWQPFSWITRDYICRPVMLLVCSQ